MRTALTWTDPFNKRLKLRQMDMTFCTRDVSNLYRAGKRHASAALLQLKGLQHPLERKCNQRQVSTLRQNVLLLRYISLLPFKHFQNGHILNSMV
jgi:hypothetical protein